MTLKRTQYCDYDKIGRMIGLYCSVCGTKIGEDRRGNFIRFNNYAELKMQFEDGQYHVTNLCSGCVLTVAADQDLMREVYDADIADMAKSVPSLADHGHEDKPRFVTVDLSRSGLP